MMSFPPSLFYYGSLQPRPRPIYLRAGQLTAVFEPDIGFLRYVRLGDFEVIRAIYAAVRDQHWNTVPPQISDLDIKQGDDSFQLRFAVACKQGEIDYFWRGEIRGDSSGTIEFKFDGEGRSSFLSNRLGLCVLHPIVECAGKTCTIEKADGTIEQATFPRHISPHQPFTSIRTMTHEVATGVRAQVKFAGNVFETEDQRNWTDASFKTYCPPLDRPFPVAVDSGTTAEQAVTIKLIGAENRRILPVVQGRIAQLSIATTPVLPKPAIGLTVARNGQRLSPQEIQRFKRLRLSHLRARLDFRSAAWRDELRLAADQAQQLGIGLQLALWLTAEPAEDLRALVSEFKDAIANVTLWIIYSADKAVTEESAVKTARDTLASHSPNLLLAAGTTSHFVELNRDRSVAESLALPCFSLSPEVHWDDNTTLIENLGAQSETLETLQQFSPKAAVISPITLRPLPSAEETPPAATPNLMRLPPDVDPRQMSLLGAGWTLGSIARLSLATNLHSLTYFETTGPRGVMETENGSPWPEGFPSLAGSVFPVYHVLADLAGFERVLPTQSTHPLQLAALTLLDQKEKRRVLVANLIEEAQDVKIKSGSGRARIRYVDEANILEAMRDPEKFRSQASQVAESVAGKIELKLLPFGLACVDLEK